MLPKRFERLYRTESTLDDPNLPPLIRMIFRGESPRAVFANFEARVGRLLSLYLSATILFGSLATVASALFLGRPHWSPTEGLLFGVALMVVAYLEYQSAIRIASAIESLPEPYAVHLSLSMKVFDPALRLLPFCWWLAHAAVILVLGELFWQGATRHPPTVETESERAFLWMVNVSFLLGFAYASNTYLILAAGALHPVERFLRRLWSFRFALDVALVLLLPKLPLPFAR